ncbi:MAG: preprotein translocase subunit YajC [Nitrospinae bacterium]|nr:preprotein translocase subunit YajC [Nitrospinota bacterium]
MIHELLTRTLLSMGPAPEGAPDQGGHTVVMLVFYAALFGIFYFSLIRPQVKRGNDLKVLQESLKKGDTVVTTGGIFGVVHKIKDDVVTVEIAENVRVKMLRNAVQERLKENDALGKMKDD